MQKIFSQNCDSKMRKVKIIQIGNQNQFKKYLRISGTALETEFNFDGNYKVISIGSYSINSTYNDQNIRVNKNKN